MFCPPFFCLPFPVVWSVGGEKSAFRRIDPHLQTRLERLVAKVREQVADLFLAPRDDVPRWCLIDRVGDSAERRLHLLPHPLDELVARQLRRGFHGKDLRNEQGLAYPDQPSRSAPGIFATPVRRLRR